MKDPRDRPPGFWSQAAEAWAEARDTASWRDVEVAKRLRRDLAQERRDLAQERQEVADLSAELHALRGREVPL